ncbi:pantothenate kinase [Pseudomonas sp. DSP3-2-2]|uniref:pantothenate kinase n=1 Tax=unclassified Pseudomonas TaxID=196821 RepID=UPI003CED5C49
MILELDCGNSFIKWRVIASGDSGSAVGGVADSDDALIATLSGLPAVTLTQCRLVSVRTRDETDKLIFALASTFAIDAVCAEPTTALAGVQNGYDDYQLLGLDRWLALVGAYQIAGKACLVLDLGTAVTSDFVTADGQHLGGFICPGMTLMRSQLKSHTRRIRYDDADAKRSLDSYSPGRSTVEAVERGCHLMLRGFAVTQLEIARQYWGEDFVIFVTGGDANLVSGSLPGARLVPDLIFVGLALACPLR